MSQPTGPERLEPDAVELDAVEPDAGLGAAELEAGQPRAVQPAVHWPDRTGHTTVDAALQAVAEVAGDPPVDQLPAYQAAHRSLRETLASIDEG